jgi:dienelactone hydrolase
MTSKAHIPTVLVALGCMLVSGACRQQAAREAEARAKRWGVPTVRIVRDVVYAEYGQRRLKLDVFVLPNPVNKGLFPGSWWCEVERGGGVIRSSSATSLDSWRWKVSSPASIEYRTADEARFPAAVHDVKAAVRWMRAHGPEYGVNPHTIGAIGGSAGAHLVAMLATGAAASLEGGGGNSATSSEVQAVVAMGGAYDLESRNGAGPEFISAVTGFIGAPLEAHTEAIAAASPIRHVSIRSAPLLLLHSPTDPLAPFQQSVEMEQAYRRAGAPVALKVIEAPGSHAFWTDTRYFPEARWQAVEFFRRHLKVPG